ncbi:MAG TPA: hypothetical protein VFI02_16945, partial [Armatimonadota bacterium]|nr:hypothetical protein [Armatimonadota bacterium]
LWNRAADEEITEPQWTPSVTKPFAYTTGSTMTVNVLMTSEDVTDAVDIRYTVGGTWRNSLGEIKGTPYSVDKDTGHGSFPYSLAHQTTALDSVMDYRLDQSYDFYVRKSSADEWCYADEGNATHPQVYLTFGAPIGPWGTKPANPPDPAVPRTCWSAVTKDACEWMEETGYPNTDEGKLYARKRLAYKAFWSSGKNYDGGPTGSHCSSDGTEFRMKAFIDDDVADCRDMSAWWVKLCNSVGMNGQLRRIDDGDTDHFITYNIDPVGSPDWQVVDWNFHQIGQYINAFDSCLQLNQSSPRVTQDESINGSYKNDLYDTMANFNANPPGSWTLGDAFSLQEVTE